MENTTVEKNWKSVNILIVKVMNVTATSQQREEAATNDRMTATGWEKYLIIIKYGWFIRVVLEGLLHMLLAGDANSLLTRWRPNDVVDRRRRRGSVHRQW